MSSSCFHHNPVKLNQIALLNTHDNSLYPLGTHHNYTYIFWSYSVQGFSPCTLRGESCIETGAYIVGTQNCEWGTISPLSLAGFIPSLSLNTFSRDDSLVFFWNMGILDCIVNEKRNSPKPKHQVLPTLCPCSPPAFSSLSPGLCAGSPLCFEHCFACSLFTGLCFFPQEPGTLPAGLLSFCHMDMPAFQQVLGEPGVWCQPWGKLLRVCWEQAVRSERPRSVLPSLSLPSGVTLAS